jgi:glutaredoxin
MQTPFTENIVVFSQNNCPACISAKQLLEARGLMFTERNLSTDPNAKADLQKSAPGARTVPQIIIGNKVISGFDMLKTYLVRK